MDLQHVPTIPTVDQPPSYNQVMEMNNFSSSKSVQFEFNCEDAFGYSFFIRDDVGIMLAKGDVYKLDTSVQNINGTQMLKIYKKESNKIDGNTFLEFDILHKSEAIGTVKVAEKLHVKTCLQIINRSPNPQTIVRSLEIGEFAIFRDNSSVTPLCNIEMSVGVENDFSGKLIFHPETGITTEEKLLCTAAGIAFKVAMNQVSKKEKYGWLRYLRQRLCEVL